MKKKNLTIAGVENKIKNMGGVEISEKEFNSSDEYKKLHDYVKRIFRNTPKESMPKRKRPQKVQ